ncbi:MAG: hypothetical protein NTV34_19705 [Proteobacteria bacterium]|nr:hypothetical protein [Pseudomonadota bacterium]
MAALKIQSSQPGPSIVVRRVLHQEGQFLCGICRQKHQLNENAASCLRKCWSKLQTGPSILLFRKLRKLEFACIYCLRSYEDQKTAHVCAKDCSTNLKIANPYSDSLSPARQPRDWNQPLFTITPQQDASAEVLARTLEALDESSKSTPITAKNLTQNSLPHVAEAPVPNEPSGDPSKGPRIPKDRTKMFERHGAKYVCVVCKTKFFTKEEVEVCFNQHD